MSEQKMLHVQQGIWIERELLQEAGLGARLQVVVQPGEIRIFAANKKKERQKSSNQGWDVFLSLGMNAASGQLQDAAEKHDHYLYEKDQ